MKRNKLAFTLAEVLITLGIIGVVAAMTVPTLVSKVSKREIETKLKEDYSILAQVNKMMIADGVYLNPQVADGSNTAIKQWFDSYMLPYMNISTVCYGTKGCWPSGKQTRMLNGGAFEDCRAGY